MKRVALRVAISVALSGLILVALFRLASPRAILELIARARPTGLLLGFGLYTAASGARAWRLRAVGLRAPGTTLMAVACVHQALNKVLPLRTGELSYPWLARRTGGQGVGEAFIGLAYLRILDLFGVAVLFAGTLAFDRRSFLGDARLGFAASLALLGGSLAVMIWLLPLLRLSTDFAARLAGPRPLLARARATIERFPKLDLRAHLALTALTVTGWLLIYGTFQTLLGAFRIPLGFARTVLGATAGVIASVQPIQGVGSFGTLEAGWALGMSLVGMERRSAVASGIGVQLFTFAYAIVLGGWGWLSLRGRAAAAAPARDGVGDPR
ncbi:MAG TPA: lysylphosphatidylglycerol synthase transmembrane domain-containing protein [Polyangia bacterium]